MLVWPYFKVGWGSRNWMPSWGQERRRRRRRRFRSKDGRKWSQPQEVRWQSVAEILWPTLTWAWQNLANPVFLPVLQTLLNYIWKSTKQLNKAWLANEQVTKEGPKISAIVPGKRVLAKATELNWKSATNVTNFFEEEKVEIWTDWTDKKLVSKRWPLS